MNKIMKNILRYISKNFQERDVVELAEYLDKNAKEVMDFCEVREDDRGDFWDKFCCYTSSKYNVLGKYLCNNNVDTYSRVTIEERNGFYYISYSNYGRNSNEELLNKYLYKLEWINEADIKEKGCKYENFCAKWLDEYCDKVKQTPKTNDKGVDVVGEINTSIKFVTPVPIKIQILVQCKCQKRPVDIPIIRHFVADCSALTFHKDEYSKSEYSILKPTILCLISHNGFTKSAKRYAEANNIHLLCSQEMLRLLELRGALPEFECIKYLNRECGLI